MDIFESLSNNSIFYSLSLTYLKALDKLDSSRRDDIFFSFDFFASNPFFYFQIKNSGIENNVIFN